MSRDSDQWNIESVPVACDSEPLTLSNAPGVWWAAAGQQKEERALESTVSFHQVEGGSTVHKNGT